MLSFKEYLQEEKKFIFDIFVRKMPQNKLVKIDSLNHDELDPFMVNPENAKKYTSLLVKRSDGNSIIYDSNGKEFVIFNKDKFSKLKPIFLNEAKVVSIPVDIVRSTKKAHLVARASDGKQGWIQKRWLRKDGTVNSKTLEKSIASAKDFKTAMDDNKKWDNTFHNLGEPARETAKAKGWNAVIDLIDVEMDSRMMVWFPKSQLEGNASKGWLINAKVKEIFDKYTFQRYGSVSVNAIGELEMLRFA